MKIIFLFFVFVLPSYAYNSIAVHRTAMTSAPEPGPGKMADRLENIDSLLLSADIVIIDFWYSACGSCRKSMPEINAIYKEYNSKKVKIYGLTPYDEMDKINSFKEALGVKYPLLMVSSAVIKKFYVSEYPTLMIFKKSKPEQTIEGYSALFGKQIKSRLDELLK